MGQDRAVAGGVRSAGRAVVKDSFEHVGACWCLSLFLSHWLPERRRVGGHEPWAAGTQLALPPPVPCSAAARPWLAAAQPQGFVEDDMKPQTPLPFSV